MGITSQVSAGEVRILVSGKFDITCYEPFNTILMNNLSGTNRFVLDLAQATYLDSSALGMLLLLREKAGEQNAQVEFVNVQPEVLKILKVAKFDQLFLIS